MSVGERLGDLTVTPIAETGKGAWGGIKAGVLYGSATLAIVAIGLIAWGVAAAGASLLAGPAIAAMAIGGLAAGGFGAWYGGQAGGLIGGAVGLIKGGFTGLHNAIAGRDHGEIERNDQTIKAKREAVRTIQSDNTVITPSQNMQAQRAKSIENLGDNQAAQTGHVTRNMGSSQTPALAAGRQ